MTSPWRWSAANGRPRSSGIFWRGNHARFSDLQRQFSDTTRKMLTQQLRELRPTAWCNREVYPQVPPKVEYSLTLKGKSIFFPSSSRCATGANSICRIEPERNDAASARIVLAATLSGGITSMEILDQK